MSIKRCWFCKRTSKEVYEDALVYGKGGDVLAEMGHGENDCILESYNIGDTQFPVCIVCSELIEQPVCEHIDDECVKKDDLDEAIKCLQKMVK